MSGRCSVCGNTKPGFCWHNSGSRWVEDMPATKPPMFIPYMWAEPVKSKEAKSGITLTNNSPSPVEVTIITERGTPAMIHELAPGESFTANVASGVSVECRAIKV